MVTSEANRFLAADVYPTWKRRVKKAQQSVWIFSPYLDRLVVDLLGNSDLGPENLAVVTDLSPASGTLDYRAQLLAIRRLLVRGVEVRTLARMHAKVLLVDGSKVTLGSQNFTSYARKSREATAVLGGDMGDSRFVQTLSCWYDESEDINLDLVDRLLDTLDNPIHRARSSLDALITAFDEEESAFREEARRAALPRFEQDLARSRSSTVRAGISGVAARSRYRAGQTTAFARLEWNGSYETLLADRELDLTAWRSAQGGGADIVRLQRLAFYPVLLGPDGRLAFARVAQTRITYVWRGVRWGAAVDVGGEKLHLRTSFPDEQWDQANLVLTFGWQHGAQDGYQLRMKFDGENALPVAEGEIVGSPHWDDDVLQDTVQSAYEDEPSWTNVLREVFSPAYNPSGFRAEKNAASYFPRGWLRINLTKFLDEAVLLVQPED